MSQLQLGAQQEQAVKAIVQWFRDPSSNRAPSFYLGGYAGSGKTTLAKLIAEELNIKVLYAAFTGKAAVVMRSKGCTNASTIHSLIYKPIEDKDGLINFVLNHESLIFDADLIIIDECSMVGEELGADLLSFGAPVLVLGDPAQLQPVKSEGYFTRGAPDFMLTEIHRQARENPIIAMSMLVRKERKLPLGVYGNSRVISEKSLDFKDVLAHDQLLCGMNRTRQLSNDRIRELKGFAGPHPNEGERLVCLKNDRKLGLLNGGLWDVSSIKKRYNNATSMVVKNADVGGNPNPVQVYVHDNFWSGNENDLDWKARKVFNEFTYGYCLTVHKSQGSQWDSVMLFDESGVFREDQWKWLYTAITRAAERITIVV